MIDKCLECDVPERQCYGATNCKAHENYTQIKADVDSCVYGINKGLTEFQIAQEIGRSESFVRNALHGGMLAIRPKGRPPGNCK